MARGSDVAPRPLRHRYIVLHEISRDFPRNGHSQSVEALRVQSFERCLADEFGAAGCTSARHAAFVRFPCHSSHSQESQVAATARLS